MGRVVNAMTPLLCPQERDTHCIGGWVGPRIGLNGCGKFVMIVLMVIMITIIYYYINSRTGNLIFV